MKALPASALYFDCDGVILDSNEIKSSAFYDVAIQFADEPTATAFLNYHQSNGGISRYQKFEYLFAGILKRSNFQSELDEALRLYAQIVYSKLLTCPQIPGIESFLKETGKTKKYVVSGGKESELEAVFRERGLNSYFEMICGSPRDKFRILSDLGLTRGAKNNGTFFGDSRLDFEAAESFGLDFVFVHGKSEFKDWKKFFLDKQIRLATDFLELPPGDFKD